MAARQTLPKTERLHSRKLIEGLFTGGGSKSMSAFPLRMVYRQIADGATPQMLVSVPKRCLHRANKRNRVKRQVREAYRRHKELIAGSGLAVAFLWLDSNLYPTDVVEQRVISLLSRLAEKVKGSKSAEQKAPGEKPDE